MAGPIHALVNGKSRAFTSAPGTSLLFALREELGLTGTKYGCGEGQCRACTVLLGGKSVAACITPVAKADRQTILTIEGITSGEKLHPVQDAFLAEGAMQCGYCTPGMIVALVGLLNETPHPTETEMLSRLERHLCRCCGYPRILKAIKRLAVPSR